MIPADEYYARAGIPVDVPVPAGSVPPGPVPADLGSRSPLDHPDQGHVRYGGVRLDAIPAAIEAIRRGEAVVVVDDEDRENEGDLIFAAQRATPELTAFMIRHTSGYICVSLTGPDLDRLGLPPMTAVNEDRKQTAYAVSVDARDIVATGISAATGRTRSRCWPTPRPSPTTSPARGT